MDDLISREKLLEQTAEWEAAALSQVGKLDPKECPEEWIRWSAVLQERTAFKHDVQDAPAETLNELPSAQPEPQWIPCSERLPENNDPVNITWINTEPESYYSHIKGKPFTATAHYCNGKWWWYSATCQDYLDEYGCSYNMCDVVDEMIKVIAWMPLPEPYKGEQDEGQE